MERRQTTFIVGIVVILIASLAFGAGTVVGSTDSNDATTQSIDVTRTIEDETLEPGETTTVTVTVSLNESEDIAVNESFTPGFSDAEIVSATPVPLVNSVNNANDELLVTWGDTSTATVEYEVTAPESAAEGETFDLSGQVETASETAAIEGDEQITITEPDAQTDTAERTIADQTIAPGETTTVTVDYSLSSSGNATLTDSFDPTLADVTVTNSDPTPVSETGTNEDVSVEWTDVSSGYLEYEVTVPETAENGNSYAFDGTLVTANSSIAVTGDDNLTVSDSAMVADRTIEDQTLGPGQSTTVTVAVDLSSTASPSVNETFDPAFSNVEITGANPLPTTQAVNGANDELVAVWSGTDTAMVEYTVTVPEDVSDGDSFTISGKATTDNHSTSIHGDSTITIESVTTVPLAVDMVTESDDAVDSYVSSSDVSFTVYNRNTNDPVSNATVKFIPGENVSNVDSFETTTNSSGTVIATFERPGTYTINVTHEDSETVIYEPTSTEVTIQPSSETTYLRNLSGDDHAIDTDEFRTAINDWRFNSLSTELLRTVIDHWRTESIVP